MRITFLYTEIAGYTVACLNALAKKGVDIQLVRWPVKSEAPFEFNLPENCMDIGRYEQEDDEIERLVDNFSPDVLYCSGWVDPLYLKISRKFRKNRPVIVGFDNQWKGTYKQRLAALFSRFTIHRNFSYAWVPGERQATFAKKLGFPETNILKGVYSADVDYFSSLRKHDFGPIPKRFIYVGRYVEWKGINELWEAFERIEDRKGWELWCVGTGELYESRPNIDGVKHLGFVQPSGMKEIIAETGVYILPSKFEPWGVSVHEFAAAGFPILTSEMVGAGDAFVRDGENGFVLKSVDVVSLKSAMESFIRMSESTLKKMAAKSINLGDSISPEKWAETILEVR